MNATIRLRTLTTKYKYLFFFFVVGFVLLLSSHNSFLYKFSEYADSNYFYLSAKLLLQGKILYRDFFEQKGPIIYFLNVLGQILVPDSFHGMYILEVVFALFYCKYIYLVLYVINSKREFFNVIVTAVSACVVYGSNIICGGGEIEEFALPLFAYTMYHIVAYIAQNRRLSIGTLICIGIHAGLLFWAKYAVLAFYIPCIIVGVVICIKRKNFKQICDAILFGTIGFLSVSACMAAYFIYTDSIRQMVEVYFLANTFDYKSSCFDGHNPFYSLVLNLYAFLSSGKFFNLLYFLVFMFLIIKERSISKDKTKSELFLLIGCLYAGVLAITAFCGLYWPYYYIPVCTVYAPMFVMAYDEVSDSKSHQKVAKRLFVAVLSTYVGVAVILSAVVGLSHRDANYNVRSELVDTIKDCGYSDVRILNHMDSGYYYLLNEVPDRYYFNFSNLRKDVIYAETVDSIEKSVADCVIVEFEKDHIVEIDNMSDYFNSYGYGVLYKGNLPSGEVVILYGRVCDRY